MAIPIRADASEEHALFERTSAISFSPGSWRSWIELPTVDPF